MDAVTLAYANTHLSELVDHVEAGASIDITRHGKIVARLIPAVRPRKRIDAGLLHALTATQQPQASSAELVRSMRDDASDGGAPPKGGILQALLASPLIGSDLDLTCAREEGPDVDR